MTGINISLLTLGNLKHAVDMSHLESWKSDLFKLTHSNVVDQLANAAGPNWEYPTQQLRNLIRPAPHSDVTIALTNARLEDNYYMRPLDGSAAVISLYEMAEILRAENFPIENFILRCVYEIVVVFEACGGVPAQEVYSWPHDEVRGCLFDMNANKPDIVHSMHRPKLCDGCQGRVRSNPVSTHFLPTLHRELARIRKPRYFQITDWVRAHPLCALAITAASAIVLNVIASIVFESVRHAMPWLAN
jgi:hypothetical protein